MPGVPYIVLLGDVGTGKSTVFEKLTGVEGRSSAANQSVTKSSDVYEAYDGSFDICDTPGSNPMMAGFQHNLQIAHALNFQPVNCILIVVKAEERMGSVIDDVEKYASFLPEDLPLEIVGVCITHMDREKLQWNKTIFLPYLNDCLGITSAVFASLNTPREVLKADVLAECAHKKVQDFSIDGEMFLRLFKVGKRNLKVLRMTRGEVARFEKMKQDFYAEKKKYQLKEQMDMTFEFLTWLFEEIKEAQKRLSNKNNFTFDGPEMASEAGHVAHMTNQLRKILKDVRMDAMQYHKDVESDFRKCPYCDSVWAKIEGCDGSTVCGCRPTEEYDIRSCLSYGEMYLFLFEMGYRQWSIVY